MAEHNALRGLLYGENRPEIIEKAKVKTERYFGTKCVQIKLDNETPHALLSGFNATFTGIVWHDLELRNYGPNVCRGCGQKDWPDSGLNEIAKEEWL